MPRRGPEKRGWCADWGGTNDRCKRFYGALRFDLRDDSQNLNPTTAAATRPKVARVDANCGYFLNRPSAENDAVAERVVRDGMTSPDGGAKSLGFETSRKEPNVCAYTHVNSAPIKKICAE